MSSLCHYDALASQEPCTCTYISQQELGTDDERSRPMLGTKIPPVSTNSLLSPLMICDSPSLTHDCGQLDAVSRVATIPPNFVLVLTNAITCIVFPSLKSVSGV